MRNYLEQIEIQKKILLCLTFIVSYQLMGQIVSPVNIRYQTLESLSEKIHYMYEFKDKWINKRKNI